jgi:drug/metabolite transporter (DMT)-like permease
MSAVALGVITLGWAMVGGLPSPVAHDVVLGVATGCIGPVAVGFLYRGLATGRMSVVAPVTAVVAAVVPFGWGILQGERPSALALVGVFLALVAVGLISGAPGPDVVAGGQAVDEDAARIARQAVAGAVVSGTGFGVVFVLLGSTTDHAGLWPLWVARGVAVVASVVGMGAVELRRRQRRHSQTEEPSGRAAWLVPARVAWPMVAVSGILDTTANGIYLAAVHRGLLSIVAVLSSLYPASTVALARVVLHERFHRRQTIGLAVATIGVVAMTLG